MCITSFFSSFFNLIVLFGLDGLERLEGLEGLIFPIPQYKFRGGGIDVLLVAGRNCERH